MNKRKVLTLCGSSRFQKEHERAQMELTLKGIIVIPMGMYGHLIPGFDMTGEIKAELDRLHFNKIDISDGIYVVNPICRVCPKCKTVWRHDTIRIEKCSCGQEIGSVEVNGYVGESTQREIKYCMSQGKEIHWLNPPTTA